MCAWSWERCIQLLNYKIGQLSIHNEASFWTEELNDKPGSSWNDAGYRGVSSLRLKDFDSTQ